MSSSTALATVGGSRTDARNDVMAVNAAEEQYVTFT
ncbi:chemotaxis protein CheW, partial [Azospirillum brasilense]|nr:chemotaxis protein CheW [Azospirillum brasilense]